MPDQPCFLCHLTYPKEVLYKIQDPPMTICGICIDVLLHWDESPLKNFDAVMEAKKFLEYTRHWLNTPKGGLCVVRNTRRLEKLDTREPEPGETEMITCEIVGSFVNVMALRVVNEDTGAKAWSMCAMVPKTDKQGLAEIEEAIEDAIKKGIEINKFPAAARPILKLPLRDGDAEVAMGKRTEEFKGHMFFNANRYESQGAPGVVDNMAQQIMDSSEIYSGAIYRLDVNFYPFKKKGQQGIACGLNNVMKVRDGDRLDGKMKAEDAFAKYKDLEASESTDQAPNVPQQDEDDIPF